MMAKVQFFFFLFFFFGRQRWSEMEKRETEKYANVSDYGIMGKGDEISRAIYSVFIELYLNQYMCLFTNVLFIGHILCG